MRRRVRMLEEELKRKQQQPEKPYEISKETPPIRELTKEKVTLWITYSENIDLLLNIFCVKKYKEYIIIKKN